MFSQEDEKEGAFRCRKHKNNKVSSKDAQSELKYGSASSLRNRRFKNSPENTRKESNDIQEEEIVWLRREDIEHPDTGSNTHDMTPRQETSLKDNNNKSKDAKSAGDNHKVLTNSEIIEKEVSEVCKTQINLRNRKVIVAEWQRIAAVVDRILFWFYFLGTVASYILILVVVPNEQYEMWNAEIRDFRISQQQTLPS